MGLHGTQNDPDEGFQSELSDEMDARLIGLENDVREIRDFVRALTTHLEQLTKAGGMQGMVARQYLPNMDNVLRVSGK